MSEPLDVDLRLVETLDDVLAMRSWLGERRPVLGLDTETGGLDWWRCDLRTVQIGDGRTGWTVPYEPWAGPLREMLNAYEDAPIALHNSKFDLHFLETHGIYPQRRLLHDTMWMVKILEPAKSMALKSSAVRHVHPRAGVGDQILKDAFLTSKWSWDTVPVDFGPYWQYAALDPVITARLYEKLAPQVMASHRGLYETELACTMVLTDMERRGVRVDFDYVHEWIPRLESFTDEMRSWVKAEFGVDNCNSDAQVIKWFHERGITWAKRTEKGNVALDEEVLTELEIRPGMEPVAVAMATAVKRYRDAAKLLSTYLRKYVELRNGEYLHASINQNGAKTGRMSISRPSLQNLPRSQHPRDAFVPRDGNLLVLCDYDQIEMRLLAHFAQEQAMIAAIRRGDELTEAGYPGFDVHTQNARAIYGIPESEPVPKAQRQVTKNSGFAKIYGAGIDQFAATAGITRVEAEAFLARYDATYPGVTRFQKTVHETALRRHRQDGEAWVQAPSGRRHIAARDKAYVLVNYLIQGTAADVLKEALIRLDNHGLARYLVLPVHDEVVADVPAEDAADYGREVQRVMTDHSFSVPLTTDVEVVDRWGTKYKKTD